MSENMQLKATAHVKLTKKDEHGNIISIEEREICLAEEEAKNLWHLQQQE